MITRFFIFSIAIGFMLTLVSTAVHCADTATVTKLNTVLRESPSEDSDNVLLLKKKAVLALIDREDTDGWMNVIHIQTGKEGWVKRKHVSLALSNKPSPELLFNEEKIDEISNPVIELENASYKDMNLKIGEVRFDVPKHSTKNIAILPGDYKYHASAPGVYPAIGKRDFITGHRYSWKFWIETKHR